MATNIQKLNYRVTTDGVKKSQKEFDGMSESVKGVGTSAVAMLGTFVSVGVVLKGLTNSFNLFIEQRNSVILMTSAISEMNAEATLSAKGLQDLASGFQKVSNIGDENILKNIFTPMINSGVKAQDTIKQLTQVILDSNANNRGSIESISEQINGVIDGSVTSYTRLAKVFQISVEELKGGLDGLSTSTQRAGALATILGGKYEGMAKKTINPVQQMQNAIGDVGEEVGKAFAPMITAMANSVSGFLSIKENVDSLVTSIQILSGSLILIGTKMVTLKAIAIGKYFATAGISVAKYTTFLAKGGYETLVLAKGLKKNVEMLRKSAISWREERDACRSGFATMETRKMYEDGQIRVREKYMSQNKKYIGNMKEIRTENQAFAKSIKLNIGSILGWITVATTVITVGYQLGKSFGWWGEKAEDVTKKMKDLTTSVGESADALSNLNRVEIFGEGELDKFSKIVEVFEDLGIKVNKTKLLGDSKGVYIKELKEIARVKIEHEALRSLYLEREEAQQTYNKLLDRAEKLKAKGLGNTDVGLIRYRNVGDELTEASKNLNILNERYKVLYTSINKVRKAKKEDEDKDEIEPNASLRQDREQPDGYHNFIQSQIDEAKRFVAYQDGELTHRKEYYNAISGIYNDYLNTLSKHGEEYMTARTLQIDGEMDKLREFGVSESQILIARKLALDELTNGATESSNKMIESSGGFKLWSGVATNSINAISSEMMGWIKITARSTNEGAKLWYAFAQSMIQQIGKIITQLLIMIAVQKIAGAFGMSMFGGTVGSLLTGFFKDAPTGGGTSTSANPIDISSGSTLSTPTGGSDIIGKLEDVVNAIYQTQTRIGDIEMAKVVESGNLQRAVI